MTIDGVQVSLNDRDAPALEDGSDVLLFLQAGHTQARTYQLVSDVVGVMAVTDARVRLPAKDEAYADSFRQLRGIPFDQVEGEIRRAVGK